jgi:cytochrome c-type biogenesis protein CcmE
MAYRWFVLPAVGIVAILVGVLVWGNLGSNLVFYLTPSEAVQRRAEFSDGERFRLGGLVVSGSVVRDGPTTEFQVTDGETVIDVVHVGAPPELFQEDIGVLVEGSWERGRVASDTLVVKHDEEYRAPDGESTYQLPPREARPRP